ncbi:hypothetical protein BGZ46_004413 [Entomortierella lignicola]|nr:hypothetical protein BGZ46_004413 [Entomortierella lignicola]
MDSPANPHAQNFQGLNQDSPLGFDLRWNDPNKGQMDMFHIASPPLTPSGVMARSPNSYNFGLNSNIKRPPLWPIDRSQNMPFPRQTPTPSQASKASNLQHIPCKFFKSGACTAGPDRKTSALLSGSNLGRSRLERRASSGAILGNNMWPSEPISPPYGSSLPQQTIQLNNNNVEFTLGRSHSQQGLMKQAMNKASSAENMRSTLYINSLSQDTTSSRSPFSEDDSPVPDIINYGNDQSNNGSNGSSVNVSSERTVAGSFGLLENKVRQHLAAPLPIRQRSLPDIFRLTPLSQDGNTVPTSPFYQPGNKGLFLSVSCESEPQSSSPLRLHSIPELHDLYTSHGNGGNETLHRRGSFADLGSELQRGDEDGYTESDDDISLDQGFLPSSLNDLLTTHERQRRQSRQEEDIDSQSNILPSPASESLQDDKEDNEDAQYSFGDSRLKPRHAFIEYGQHGVLNGNSSISPLAMFIPGGGPISSSYGSQDPSFFEEEDHYGVANRRGPYYKKSSTPDPFCPFPQDVNDTHFTMDDDLALTGDIGNSSISGFLGTRSGFFDRDSTSTASKGLNRAVGPNSNVHRQNSQYQAQLGTMTPASLPTREDEVTFNFSSLSISNRAFLPKSNAGSDTH